MPEHIDVFESMMRELVQTEGAKLLEEEKLWRGRVPRDIDSAARMALSSGAIIKAAAPVKAGIAAGHGARIAAAIVAAAVAVSGGIYAASPAVRARTAELFGGSGASTGIFAARQAEKSPADYIIPAPGEDYEITDEATGDSMRYIWFTSSEREVLVEIANRLTDGAYDPGAEILFLSDGSMGAYSGGEDSASLVVQDGDIDIRVTFSNAEQDDVLSYAELLIAANAN